MTDQKRRPKFSKPTAPSKPSLERSRPKVAVAVTQKKVYVSPQREDDTEAEISIAQEHSIILSNSPIVQS